MSPVKQARRGNQPKRFIRFAVAFLVTLTVAPAGAEACEPIVEGPTVAACPTAPPSAADPLPLSGEAFAFEASLTVAGAGASIPKVAPVVLPPTGGGPFTERMATLDLASLGRVEQMRTSTEGATTRYALSSASASEVHLTLGDVTLRATGVRAVASCSGDGIGDRGAETGGATIGSLTIDGTPMDVDVEPNTWIPLPGGIGGVMLRERWDRSDPAAGYRSFMENMIHVYLTSGPVIGEVVISSARCDGIELAGSLPR